MNTYQIKNLSLNLTNNTNNGPEVLHNNSINSQNPINTYPDGSDMDDYLELYCNNDMENVEEDDAVNDPFSRIREPPPIIPRNYDDPNHTIDSEDDPLGAQFERGYYWSGELSDSDISVSSDMSLLNSFRIGYPDSGNE